VNIACRKYERRLKLQAPTMRPRRPLVRCERTGMPRKSRAKPCNPFRGFKSSPDVIRRVVTYVRYPQSLRNVEDPLFERHVAINHETDPAKSAYAARRRSRAYPAGSLADSWANGNTCA
jgi:hypothetical protein